MTVDEWLHSNLGYISVIISVMGLAALTIFLTSLWKDYAWQKTLGMYGDDISKNEIRKRDDTIKQLTAELEDETKQCESLRVKVKSMAAFGEKAIEIAGETYRRNPE